MCHFPFKIFQCDYQNLIQGKSSMMCSGYDQLIITLAATSCISLMGLALHNVRQSLAFMEKRMKDLEHDVKVRGMYDPIIINLRNKAQCIWLNDSTTLARKHNDLQNLIACEIDGCNGIREERKTLINMIHLWLGE